nr:hypothetical protein Iba_chr07dCG4960 [Ipomoea batatas]
MGGNDLTRTKQTKLPVVQNLGLDMKCFSYINGVISLLENGGEKTLEEAISERKMWNNRN